MRVVHTFMNTCERRQRARKRGGLSMGRVPIVDTLQRVPGGMMLIPLLLGSLVRTFWPGFLELGSFTSALFRDSALPLIALLIFATGAQIDLRQSGRVLAKTGAV